MLSPRFASTESHAPVVAATVRIAYMVSHPIQYQAPLLRRLAREKGLDITTLFLSDFSAREYRDPGFGQAISWTTDLLGGYKSLILPAYGHRDAVSFWRPFTRGVEVLLNRGKYDVLWLHGYAHHAQLRAVIAAKTAGMKVFLRGESHVTSSSRPRLVAAAKRKVLAQLFRLVDGFLAIGTANRRYYLEHCVPAHKIFMMPYAVDNTRFRVSSATRTRDELGVRLGLKAGRPVILSASKLQPRKRPWDIWEAYKSLSANGIDEPTPYLIFVGEGTERERLESAAACLGWNSVRFVGFQTEATLPAYYGLADVFVLASECEPWGLVVNEAMNAGKPVIVTDQVGAAADLVLEGKNGYVISTGDVSMLADRLRRITSDRTLAQSMGEESARRIASWDFEADVKGLLEAIRACGL